jgi:hypothetical protein
MVKKEMTQTQDTWREASLRMGGNIYVCVHVCMHLQNMKLNDSESRYTYAHTLIHIHITHTHRSSQRAQWVHTTHIIAITHGIAYMRAHIRRHVHTHIHICTYTYTFTSHIHIHIDVINELSGCIQRTSSQSQTACRRAAGHAVSRAVHLINRRQQHFFAQTIFHAISIFAGGNRQVVKLRRESRIRQCMLAWRCCVMYETVRRCVMEETWRAAYHRFDSLRGYDIVLVSFLAWRCIVQQVKWLCAMRGHAPYRDDELLGAQSRAVILQSAFANNTQSESESFETQNRAICPPAARQRQHMKIDGDSTVYDVQQMGYVGQEATHERLHLKIDDVQTVYDDQQTGYVGPAATRAPTFERRHLKIDDVQIVYDDQQTGYVAQAATHERQQTESLCSISSMSDNEAYAHGSSIASLRNATRPGEFNDLQDASVCGSEGYSRYFDDNRATSPPNTLRQDQFNNHGDHQDARVCVTPGVEMCSTKEDQATSPRNTKEDQATSPRNTLMGHGNDSESNTHGTGADSSTCTHDDHDYSTAVPGIRILVKGDNAIIVSASSSQRRHTDDDSDPILIGTYAPYERDHAGGDASYVLEERQLEMIAMLARAAVEQAPHTPNQGTPHARKSVYDDIFASAAAVGRVPSTGDAGPLNTRESASDENIDAEPRLHTSDAISNVASSANVGFLTNMPGHVGAQTPPPVPPRRDRTPSSPLIDTRSSRFIHNEQVRAVSVAATDSDSHVAASLLLRDTQLSPIAHKNHAKARTVVVEEDVCAALSLRVTHLPPIAHTKHAKGAPLAMRNPRDNVASEEFCDRQYMQDNSSTGVMLQGHEVQGGALLDVPHIADSLCSVGDAQYLREYKSSCYQIDGSSTGDQEILYDEDVWGGIMQLLAVDVRYTEYHTPVPDQMQSTRGSNFTHENNCWNEDGVHVRDHVSMSESIVTRDNDCVNLPVDRNQSDMHVDKNQSDMHADHNQSDCANKDAAAEHERENVASANEEMHAHAHMLRVEGEQHMRAAEDDREGVACANEKMCVNELEHEKMYVNELEDSLLSALAKLEVLQDIMH